MSQIPASCRSVLAGDKNDFRLSNVNIICTNGHQVTSKSQCKVNNTIQCGPLGIEFGKSSQLYMPSCQLNSPSGNLKDV